MTTPPNAPEVDVLSRMRTQAAQYWVDSGNFMQAELIAQTQQDRTSVEALLTCEAALVARNAELERLCDSTYVEQGADAYHNACEVMEAWQKARCAAGKDPGCEGSLCDGLSWLQTRIAKTEDERDALIEENLRLSEKQKIWERARHNAASERDALAAEVGALREALTQISSLDPVGGDDWIDAVNQISKIAASALARAEAGHG